MPDCVTGPAAPESLHDVLVASLQRWRMLLMRALEKEASRFSPERTEAAKIIQVLVQVRVPSPRRSEHACSSMHSTQHSSCSVLLLCVRLLLPCGQHPAPQQQGLPHCVCFSRCSCQRCPGQVPVLLFRSLVAVANSETDPMRRVCLEILRIACMRRECLRAMAGSGGFQPLFAATVDPICKVWHSSDARHAS